MPRPDEYWRDKEWPPPARWARDHVDVVGIDEGLADVSRYMMESSLDLAEYWHEVYMILLEMKNAETG